MSWILTEIHIACLPLMGWVLRAISEISENVIKKDPWKTIVKLWKAGDCFAQNWISYK